MDARAATDVCGSSVRRSRVVLMSRCWHYVGGKCPADNGGKRAVLREEHEVSRKAIAQGRPECSSCPVCSCAHLFAQIARETAGAASTRSSLRPLFRGQEVDCKPRAQRAARLRSHICVGWVSLRSTHPTGPESCLATVASETPVARMSAARSGDGTGWVPGFRCAHPSYEAASNLKTAASTRQRNNGESGGGDSSGVQPVNFSS